ncbi:MarR family transcriptional regulator [Cryobacterium fucosi]|uniref:MarR family transcriptional regulator n=1 Tax=Cryobacterium fucosi TaxID=1259157 RepID=A0A4R9AXV3_9MICO|nr:MarR family transcriptional regulator [Cryobacterium fucosi]
MRQAELLRYLVLAAQREGYRRLTRELRAIGLTPAQSEVLRILGDHAPLSLSGLGGLLVSESGTNPSRLVDRLVTAGMIERAVDDADRRHVVLTLTEAGIAAEGAVRVVENRLYADLDTATSDLDLRPVINTLRRLSSGSLAGAALQNRLAHAIGHSDGPAEIQGAAPQGRRQ